MATWRRPLSFAEEGCPDHTLRAALGDAAKPRLDRDCAIVGGWDACYMATETDADGDQGGPCQEGRPWGAVLGNPEVRGGDKLEMDMWSQAHTWDFHVIPRTATTERQDKASNSGPWCSRKIFSIIASQGVLCFIINVCSIFGLT